MSSYYTLISKVAQCPQYNKSVILSAKYRFTENPQSLLTQPVPLLKIQGCPKMNNAKNINI